MDGTGMLIVNVIWVFPVKEFVYESRRDFIASTNNNTVQPQTWWKSVLSVRVKTAVRAVDQVI